MKEQEVRALRQLPLEAVAQALGYHRDPRDRARWKRPGSVLSINGEMFYDHLAGKGGRGAVSLVMDAEGAGFLQACQTLAGLPAVAVSLTRPAPPRRELRPLRHNPRAWPAVEAWLISRRGLDPGLVGMAREEGLLMASRWEDAVFICRDASGQTTGAEIVGTRQDREGQKRMATGSSRARGGFWMTTSGKRPQTLFLAEGAIDALSILSIPVEPARQEPAFAVLSTAGVARTLPKWIRAWPVRQIIIGYDADRAGDEATGRLTRRHKRALPHRPVEDGQDWNDILMRIRSGKAHAIMPWSRNQSIPSSSIPQQGEETCQTFCQPKDPGKSTRTKKNSPG